MQHSLYCCQQYARNLGLHIKWRYLYSNLRTDFCKRFQSQIFRKSFQLEQRWFMQTERRTKGPTCLINVTDAFRDLSERVSRFQNEKAFVNYFNNLLVLYWLISTELARKRTKIVLGLFKIISSYTPEENAGVHKKQKYIYLLSELDPGTFWIRNRSAT
jgi:hypothetical protein